MKKKKPQYMNLMDSKFYRTYFIVLTVALIAIAIGLLWLNGVVKDYETPLGVEVMINHVGDCFD